MIIFGFLGFCFTGALIVVCALWADRYGRGLRNILNKDRDWLDDDTLSARADGSSPTEATNDRPSPTGHQPLPNNEHGQSSPEHKSSGASYSTSITRADYTFGHQLIAGGSMRRIK